MSLRTLCDWLCLGRLIMGEDPVEKPTIYFGYGSNLWLDQMVRRCPESVYKGIARLKDYRWIISERGYANIVQVDEKNASHDYKNEVWGLVYSLTPSDEKRLDVNEGVPKSYQKLTLECDFWSANAGLAASTKDKPVKTDMLVYVSKDFVTPSKPKKEYIYRMNMGVKDALLEGVPKAYIKQVIREYIPEESDDNMKDIAQKQALYFEDER